MKSVQCEPEVPIARRKAPARVRYPGPHGAQYHTAAVEGVVERAGHRVWFSWGSGSGGRAPARSTDDPSPSRLVRQSRPTRASTRRGEWLPIHRCVRAGFPAKRKNRRSEVNWVISQGRATSRGSRTANKTDRLCEERLGFGTAKAVIASKGCDGTCIHAVGSLAGGGS